MQSMSFSGIPVKGISDAPRRFQTPRCHTAKRSVDLRAIRLRDLTSLINSRHGSVLPDTAMGRTTLFVWLNHLAFINGDQRRRVTMAVAERAPWMPEDEAELLVDTVCRRPRRYKAEVLGRLLNLTYTEKVELRITTIRAVSEPTQREKERIKKERQRRKAGVQQRRKGSSEPWKEYGLPKSTYYRRKRNGTLPARGETNGSRAYTSLKGLDTHVPSAPVEASKPAPVKRDRETNTNHGRRPTPSPTVTPPCGGVGSGRDGVRRHALDDDIATRWVNAGFPTVGGVQ